MVAALKCLYLATRSVDPTGDLTGSSRALRLMRRKPTLNAFATEPEASKEPLTNESSRTPHIFYRTVPRPATIPRFACWGPVRCDRAGPTTRNGFGALEYQRLYAGDLSRAWNGFGAGVPAALVDAGDLSGLGVG